MISYYETHFKNIFLEYSAEGFIDMGGELLFSLEKYAEEKYRSPRWQFKFYIITL